MTMGQRQSRLQSQAPLISLNLRKEFETLVQAREILLYYAALTVLTLLLILRRRPLKGMRLRLRGPREQTLRVDGATPPEAFSHIRPTGERPLNVVFNYNGHSWDAYEVLGLPAGSSPEKVEQAYRQGLNHLDKSSHHFLEAAYAAIQTEWQNYQKAGAG